MLCFGEIGIIESSNNKIKKMARRKKTKKVNENFERDGTTNPNQLLVAALIVFVAAIFAFVGHSAYSWKKPMMSEKYSSGENEISQLKAEVMALKKQLALNKSNKDEAESSRQVAIEQNSSPEFEKAVNGGDFSGAETFVASRVYYVVDASECCGDISKKEAMNHLEKYIRDAGTFDFDQDQQVVKQMKVNLAGTFSSYTIGVAENGMVLSYKLDKQGKVNNVMLSASHLMYDLE